MEQVYDASPASASLPLGEDEVVRLLRTDGRFFTRDPALVKHLLSRVAATVKSHQRSVRQLHGDVDRLSASVKNRAAPLAAAVEALGRLSVDEQRQVLDVHAQGIVATLREATADARRLKLAAVSEGNRVRLVMAQVAADESIPADVKERLTVHLAALPAASDLPAEPVGVDLDHDLPPGLGGFAVEPDRADELTTLFS